MLFSKCATASAPCHSEERGRGYKNRHAAMIVNRLTEVGQTIASLPH